MTLDQIDRFMRLRERTFAFIRQYLETEPHHKAYEGEFSIVFPNCFGNIPWTIKLSCYVLGPARHYNWGGDSFEECLDKAEKDIDQWIKEEKEWLLE